MSPIIKTFTSFRFVPSEIFVWSPKDNAIYYNQKALGENSGELALLHEVGHAKLGHQNYKSDIELLNMEVDAWEFARDQAPQFNIEIDEDHINLCLETYRVWLYKRATCPKCENHGIQKTTSSYYCFMCRHTWRVADSLTLQPHRMDCKHALAEK